MKASVLLLHKALLLFGHLLICFCFDNRIVRWLKDMVNKFCNVSSNNPQADIYRKALDAYQRGLSNMQHQSQSQGENRYYLNDIDRVQERFAKGLMILL